MSWLNRCQWFFCDSDVGERVGFGWWIVMNARTWTRMLSLGHITCGFYSRKLSWLSRLSWVVWNLHSLLPETDLGVPGWIWFLESWKSQGLSSCRYLLSISLRYVYFLENVSEAQLGGSWIQLKEGLLKVWVHNSFHILGSLEVDISCLNTYCFIL